MSLLLRLQAITHFDTNQTIEFWKSDTEADFLCPSAFPPVKYVRLALLLGVSDLELMLGRNSPQYH